jgi:nucleoside phosphorylase
MELEIKDKIRWPKLHFGKLLSGNTLINNAGYLNELLKLYPKAIGGEMEGTGLALAAHQIGFSWILIKGISDFASDKDRNKEKRQIEAASNAAKVAYELLYDKDSIFYRNHMKQFENELNQFTAVDDPRGNQISLDESVREQGSQSIIATNKQLKVTETPIVTEIYLNKYTDTKTSSINISTNVDVLIIIATKDEEDAILSLPLCKWQKCTLKNRFDYFKAFKRGLHIALVRGEDMGETNASIIGQAAISELEPSYIAMVGFCAGQSGEVQLGDIIVPKKVYQYGEGKQLGKSKFLPEIHAFNLDPSWVLKVERFGNEWRKKYNVKQPPSYQKQNFLFVKYAIEKANDVFNPYKIAPKEEIPHLETILGELIKIKHIVEEAPGVKLTSEGKNEFQRIIARHDYRGAEDEMTPQTRVGVIATGHKVQQWSGIFNYLSEKHDRKTIALDMESHAIAKLADSNKRLPWIIAKGVGDFARDGKAFDNKTFVPFACQTSFPFVIEFLIEIKNETLFKNPHGED